MPNEIHSKYMDQLDIYFSHGIKHTLHQNDFYDNLKPSLKSSLIRRVIEKYIRRFCIFFEDTDLPFYSCDAFITECLSNLECRIFNAGDVIV